MNFHRSGKFRPWLRYPRTYQERRANGVRSKWARSKRNANNLPTSYDDIFVREEKCWKARRKTQYRVGGRGEKYSLYFPYNDYKDWRKIRLITDYLEEQDIPHCLDRHNEIYFTSYTQYYEKVCVGSVQTPWYIHPSGYVRTYTKYLWEDRKLDEPIVHNSKHSRCLGYFIYYWPTKKIDLTFLTDRCII